MNKTILIIGATGTIGKPVAKTLNKNFKVRLLVRNKSTASQQFGDEYEYVEGDLFDESVLKTALSGCYGVHVNLSGEIEQIGTELIVKHAKNVDIKHITYISGTSVCEKTSWFPLEKRKLYAEKAIVASDIPYTIFCPTWFMESLPRFVKSPKAYIFGKQPNKYHFIAAQDYAKMVLIAYQNEKAINQRFILHGKEGFYFKEALEMYCKVIHPEIKSVSTIPYLMAKIIATLKNKPEMRETAEFMSFFENTGELGNPSETYKLFGEPETTLEKWIEIQKKNRA